MFRFLTHVSCLHISLVRIFFFPSTFFTCVLAFCVGHTASVFDSFDLSDFDAALYTYTLTHARARTHAHTHTHTRALTHTHTHTHTLSLSLSLSHTHVHTQTHTDTRTHPTQMPTRQQVAVQDLPSTATHCNTLQHTAAYCNTQQHTAAYCKVLPSNPPSFLAFCFGGPHAQCAWPAQGTSALDM